MTTKGPDFLISARERVSNLLHQVRTRKDSQSPEALAVKVQGLTYIAQSLAGIQESIPQGEFVYTLPDPFLPSKDSAKPNQKPEAPVAIVTENVELAYDPNGIHIYAIEAAQHRRHGIYISLYKEPGEDVAYVAENLTGDRKTFCVMTDKTRSTQYDADTIPRRLISNILDSARAVSQEVYARTQNELVTTEDLEASSQPNKRSISPAEDIVLRTAFPNFTEWFHTDLPTRVTVVSPEGSAVMHSKESNSEVSADILRQIRTDMGDITQAFPVRAEDLPCIEVNPDEARFIARNSVLICNETQQEPVGMLFASPDSGHLIYQSTSRPDLPFAPTVFFRDPSLSTQPGVPTIEIGYTPFGNPNDARNTVLYPITRDAVQITNLIAPELLRVVLASNRVDFPLFPQAMHGMPYIGSYAIEWNRDRWTFEDYVSRVITTAIPNKYQAHIVADFDISRENDHIHNLSLSYGDKSFGAIIDVDPNTEQSHICLTMTEGEKQKQLQLSLHDRGIQVNGILVDSESVKQHKGLQLRVIEARYMVERIYDAWSILQKQQKTYIPDTAQDNIPDVLLYLLQSLNANGTVNSLFPFRSPFTGGSTTPARDFLVPPPLVDESQTITGESLLPPREEMREAFWNDSFVGQLAQAEHRQTVAKEDTAPIPAILLPPAAPQFGYGELVPGELIDVEQLKGVALFQTENPPEEAALPSSIGEHETVLTDSSSPLPDVFQGWETVASLDQQNDESPERDLTTHPLPTVDTEEHVTSSDTLPKTQAARRRRRRSAQI